MRHPLPGSPRPGVVGSEGLQLEMKLLLAVLALSSGAVDFLAAHLPLEVKFGRNLRKSQVGLGPELGFF